MAQTEDKYVSYVYPEEYTIAGITVSGVKFLEPNALIGLSGLRIGQKVDIPSYRVSKWDIVDVRPKSVETTPFIIARETIGDRPVPAWLQVVATPLRILVHQLPERAQIDVPVKEQLIVELYSK